MPTRRPGTALLAALLAVPLATLAAWVAAPGWVRGAGLDWWNLPAQERQLRANGDRDRDLDAEREATARRMAVREALVADLIAGRSTLAGAVAEFRALDRGWADRPELLRWYYSGVPDDEVEARHVIGYALRRVPGRADREALRRRLEGELRELLARPEPAGGAAGVRIE
jgi:hypothetical protein